MTKNLKIFLALVVIAIISWSVWATKPVKKAQAPTPKSSAPLSVQKQAPLDSSDASISNDLGNMDAQMTGLGTDSVGISDSLSQQQAPTAQ